MDTINNSMLLNTIRAYTSTEQKKQRMKELTKQWINNNRTKLNEYQKQLRKKSKIKKLYNDQIMSYFIKVDLETGENLHQINQDLFENEKLVYFY